MDKLPQMNAYILTGGNSRRFGSAKAVAEIQGISFLDTIYTTISPHFTNVFSVGKKTYSPLMKNIFDKYKTQAPLIGVITALQHSSVDWNFIISVDMPFISSEVLNELKKSYSENPSAEIILPWVNNKLMPLVALYHKNCLTELEKAYAKGDYSLVKILDSFNYTDITMDYFRHELANINTVEALHDCLKIKHTLH